MKSPMNAILWDKESRPYLLVSRTYVLNGAYHISYIRRHSGLYTTPDKESKRVLEGDFSRLTKCTLITKCPEIEGVYCSEETYQQFMDLAKPTDPRLDISYQRGIVEMPPIPIELDPSPDESEIRSYEADLLKFVPYGSQIKDGQEILKRYYEDEISAETVCDFWFRRFNLEGLYPNGFILPNDSAIRSHCMLYDLSESELITKLKKLAETSATMRGDGFVFIDNEFHQLQED